MAKPERGLPKSFDIKVPDGPVRLGDYLDEPPPAPPVASPVPAPAAPAFQPAPAPETPPPSPTPPSAPAYFAAAPAAGVVTARAASPPRKQFNMAPETLRMLDELLTHIRMYSAERDVRASELVHALVLAVHEVRPFLDLTAVPPRGKWGSPSAAALPVALKDACQKAIARARAR